MNNRSIFAIASIVLLIGVGVFYTIQNKPAKPKPFEYGKSKITFVNNFEAKPVNKAIPILKRKAVSKKLPGQFALMAKSKSALFVLDKNVVKSVDNQGLTKILHQVDGELGGIDIDAKGNIYIAEAKLISSKKVVGELTPIDPKITVLSSNGKVIKRLKMPADTYILPRVVNNKLFVSDFHSHIPVERKMEQQSISVFDLNGKLMQKIKGIGNIKSYGIDAKENIYTATQLFKEREYSGLKVSKLSSNGQVINEKSFPIEEGKNGFQEVLGFAGVDANGFIYISYDRWKKPGVVKKFDINGQLKETFSKPSFDFDWLLVSQEGEVFNLKDTSPSSKPHREFTLYKMSH